MNIFKFLIFLHLFVCLKFSISLLSSLNLDWQFNINIENILSKLKSSAPDFIKNIQKNLKGFLAKTEKEKMKYIYNLEKNVQDIYEQIKIGIQKGSNSVQKEIKILIEKTTETSNALSYIICDPIKEEYEDCFCDKKKIFSNLLEIVNDNFGKCSTIINEIYNLSDNIEYNFKYFLFLLLSLTENPDIIEKGKSQIIYDIINCLLEKFNYLWPTINSSLAKNVISLSVKQDIINLLAKSISNSVTLVQFEEHYGYIEKAENITSLIKNERAREVYNNIFKIIKYYNQFGTQSYNISANLDLNVFTDENETYSNSIKNINYKEKGIKVNFNLNYMLKDLKVYSVQAVVFESPLVSLRAQRKTNGGTSNTFVGITLYDKEGNEIYISDIKLKNFRPEILFKRKLFKSMKRCLYYNEEKDIMDSEGIETQFFELNGEEYIKCIPQHLSSFTIGSYTKASLILKTERVDNIFNKSILTGGLVVIILIIVFYLYRLYRRKRTEFINNQYN